MFHDNDSQLVVNLDYQMVLKELAFMITKTLSIQCFTIICDVSLDSLEHNKIHYIISLKNHSIFQSNFKRTN